MGLKTKIKEAIVVNRLKKKAKTAVYDEVAIEKYEHPENARKELNNSYYFSCHGQDGSSFVYRFAKRGENIGEVWAMYLAANGDAYMNKDMMCALDKPSATVTCITPLEKWEFTFKGKMQKVKPDASKIARPTGEEFYAEFKGTYDSKGRIFEFTRDLDPKVFAKAVAAEKWDKNFQNGVDKNHQAHIEQRGHVKGDLKIGNESITIDLPCLRDHSFGKRIWADMYQHMWLMILSEDGNVYNINSVKYAGLSARGIIAGYKMEGDNKPVSAVDAAFEDELGKTGLVALDTHYAVTYTDESTLSFSYDLQIAFPYVFEEGGYTLYEGISSYTINGKKGRGISEFGYNGDKTKYS